MRGIKIDPAEALAVRSWWLANGRSRQATCAHFGLDRGAVERRLKAAEGVIDPAQHISPADPVIPPKPYVPSADVTRLEDKVRALTAELRGIHRDNLEAESVRKTIFGLAERTPEPPSWLVRVAGSQGVTGVPVTIWSDWHMGETVFSAQVNGVNAFNMEIAEQRIRRLVDRTIDLCFRHMTNPSYPGIVVNIIGDMVTGEIHDELTQTNDDEVMPVVLRTTDLLIWGLSRLADHFGRVFCPCAPGNHGRTTKRIQAKNFVVKNWDWLIYTMLERHFRTIGDDRVQFQIPETGECLYRVYGHRYMAIHGHDLGVKGGDGIIGAIGPISRGQMKVSHSQAQIGRDFDTLLMGHWHQMLWLPRAIVNNTLKGYDEFARSFLRAGFSVPSQALWFSHPARGITARWEVTLEDAPVKKDIPWVSWEAAA